MDGWWLVAGCSVKALSKRIFQIEFHGPVIHRKNHNYNNNSINTYHLPPYHIHTYIIPPDFSSFLPHHGSSYLDGRRMLGTMAHDPTTPNILPKLSNSWLVRQPSPKKNE